LYDPDPRQQDGIRSCSSRAPADGENAAHAGDAPLVFGLLGGLAAILFMVEIASRVMNAKVASALAVLAMAAAVLRLPPLPAGASAFFFLVILGGYVRFARPCVADSTSQWRWGRYVGEEDWVDILAADRASSAGTPRNVPPLA
jgi:hypothetical protein